MDDANRCAGLVLQPLPTADRLVAQHGDVHRRATKAMVPSLNISPNDLAEGPAGPVGPTASGGTSPFAELGS